ncbi:type I-E CRISPR-associated protein Cse2/CasB [Streptomyces sp. NPDC008317]|uniref:type I-E CRISPR-associated protein Cse2/CasB n=1 Tax=Streptomyces sp. NPDC008317 TaxID=3364827 RepID=UPI0036ED1478
MTAAPAPAASAKQLRLDQHDEFIAYILNWCAKSKEAQADLRSGLGRPVESCTRMHRYLVPRLPRQDHPDQWYSDTRRAQYAVAALVAARPRRARDADAAASASASPGPAAAPADWWTRPNLGASMAEAVNKKLLKPGTAEDDLHLMARQSSEAIQIRLPSLTTRLLNGGVSVDWAVLLDDLSRWNRDRDRTATRWVESYFRVRTLEDREEESSKENG